MDAVTAEIDAVDIVWRALQNVTEQNVTDDEVGDDDAADAIVYNDSEIIRNTVTVYGSMLLAIVLIFCWARRRFPNAYNLRNWVDPIKSPLAESQGGFFSWMTKVYHVTDDEFMDECGMDALCFARITQMGFKLSCVGIFNSIWLMIVYSTSETTDENKSISDGIVEVTVANVPEETPRLMATTLAAYVFFGYFMYLLLVEELPWFTEMRHKFLKKPRPSNYTIFVRNIPESFRNNGALEEFMGSCFTQEAISEAQVPVTAKQLGKLQSNRDAVLGKLEHALAEYEKTGNRPTHKSGIVGGAVGVVGLGERIDSIEAYKIELTELNEQVDNAVGELQQKIDAMSSIPYLGSQRSQGILSGISNEGISVASHDLDMESKIDESKKDSGAVAVVGGALSGVGNLATGAIGGALGKAGNLASGAADLLTGSEDGTAYPSGFVSFRKLSSTNAALQMVHNAKPFCMETCESPDPDDIRWLNVGRTNKDLQIGRLMSLGITVTICVLWTIPMSFIATLSTVEGLRDEVEFIDDLLNTVPFLVPVLEIAAPLFVVIVNSLLPVILEAVTLLEGPISGAVVEASLFVKLAAFMIIQTFFVSAISGSVIDKIAEMIDSPTIIINLLATSLPKQATYFMQISFVSITVSGGMEILRVVPIALAVARSFIGPKLTEKERRTTFLGLRPLYDPLEFQHADFTSNAVFYFMVLFVYSVISPLTNFILAFVFISFGTLLRHQFIFVYPTGPDSGGKIWSNCIKILVTCMLVAEVTLLGLLGLKKAAIATPLFIPLLICSFLFSYYIREEHFRVADFLPSRDCLAEDSHRSSADLEFLKGAYLQPELTSDRKAWPESMKSEMEDKEETSSPPEQSDEEKNLQPSSSNTDDGKKKTGSILNAMFFR